MTQILCKDSVRLKGVTPALAWMFYVLDGLARHRRGLPDQLVITSIYDGKHSPNSRHYRGEAIDLRSKNFPTVAAKRAFRAELENALNTHPVALASGVGNLFRVLLEGIGTPNEHFHIQVKKGATFKGV